MTKHQLRLLLSAGGALALMIASMFAIEWFRITVEGVEQLARTSIKLELRTVSVCMSNGGCESVAWSKVQQIQNFYPTISVLTFYSSCVLVLILAFQTGARLLGNQAGDGLKRLGFLFAVVTFLAAAATAYLFQPDSGTMDFGPLGMATRTVTRTWGPVMMLLGTVFAMFALHYASAEWSFDTIATPADAKRLPVTPVRATTPVAGLPYKAVRPSAIPFESIPIEGRKPSAPKIDARLSANDPVIEVTPSKPRAASSIPLDERLSANESPNPDTTDTAPDAGPAISRTTSSMDTAPDAIARAMSSIPFDGRSLIPAPSDDFELPLPPVARSKASPFMMESDLPSAKPEPKPEPAKLDVVVEDTKPDPVLRAKLSFATSTVSLSTDGVDATCESGDTVVVAWTDVVGVVARRLPPEAPYGGETFVDLVSTSGSTLRILPWTELTGDALHAGDANPIERARAFVQLVASRCPTAKLDAATRTFLGSRGLAAQLPDAAILAQHDERLS